MKKYLFLIAVLVFTASLANLSQAAPVGNPADPVFPTATYPIKAEGIVDIVFDRDFDISPEPAEIKGQWYLSKISVTLFEKIDLYGLLGTADLKVDDWPPNTYTLETDRSVAWGGGFKLLLYETAEYGDGILRVSFDGNYRHYEPTVEKVKKSGVDLANVLRKDFNYREWQAGLGISYSIDLLTPYFGFKYSDVECKIGFEEGGNTYEKTANSKDIAGVFVGVDYLMAENIFLNLEGRFIDETALNVGAKINF